MRQIMWQHIFSLLAISELILGLRLGVITTRIRTDSRTKHPRIKQLANACTAYSSSSKTCRSGSRESNWKSKKGDSATKCMTRCAKTAEQSQKEKCCVFVEGDGCYIMTNRDGIRESRTDDPHIGMATVCSVPSLQEANDADEEPIEFTPIPRGTKVRYYSSSKDRWINAYVEDFVDGYYQLNVKSRANVDNVRLLDGTAVEYFSTSKGGWIPAVVEGLRDSFYKLDVHPGADPVKVRLLQESSPEARVEDEEDSDGELQAEVDAIMHARSDGGEVGRCSRYKNSTTETCKSGSISSLWFKLWDGDDRNRCAERCRTLAVRTDSEICCTVETDGCWGIFNRGGVRDSRDDDHHVGSVVVCAPPIQTPDSLSASLGKWADVRDENFLSNEAMVRGGKYLGDMFADVSPKDLRQGSLGDCWLIASIASLAIYPIAVRSIFTQQFANAKGEYAVQLWHPEKSEWVRLTIDDKVPVESKWSNTPKYIDASDAGGFWPMLLEKAFAKLLGGYDELQGHGGYTAVAYAALSGSSPNYMYWWLESENRWAKGKCTGLGNTKYSKDVRREKMWDLLYDAYNDNKLLSGSCCKAGVLRDGAGERGFAGEGAKENGLYDDHAYSILAVKYFEPGHKVKYCVNAMNSVVNDVLCRGAGDGSFEERTKTITSIDAPLRLVQVRNPWGNDLKFTGKWSYADRRTWSKHPDIKSVVDYRDEADGTWWMTYEELEHTFRKIYIGSQDMIQFDPPPPECNIGYGGTKFDGVRIKWKNRIHRSKCAFCESGVPDHTECDGSGTGRGGKFCCTLINAKLRGTLRA